MELKKSVVKSAIFDRTWDGKYGTMYDHKIAFSNGDIGVYSSKLESQGKFSVGAEAEYEWQDGQYPKVKPVSNYSSGSNYSKTSYSNKGDDVQKYIIRQSSLKCANELHIATGNVDKKDIINTAQYYTDWVMNTEKIDSKIEVKTKVEQGEDLPF